MRKQNADHHSNKVVNKTIGKDFGNHLAECAEVNQDKSAMFIFNKFEAKIEAKNIHNFQVDVENQRKSISINLNI